MKSAESFEIVLVHGGFSDGSVWRQVILGLQEQGYFVSAAQLPLTSFEEDVAALECHLATRNSRVLLVGHSYGGVVITEVSARSTQVVGIVYVAATVPAAGELYGAFMQKYPARNPVSIVPDANGLLWASEELFEKVVAQDLTLQERRLAQAVQKPISVNIYGAKLSLEGWRTKKTWYLVSENDLLFSALAQQESARKMNAEVEVILSGHISPLSQPKKVTEFIAKAAKQVRD